MERQLVLIEPEPADWQLDDATRAIGREGVAAARKALEQARRAAIERTRSNAA
jgi:hypothetical protein